MTSRTAEAELQLAALIGCDECLLHAKVCERMMSLLKPSRIGPCRLARLNFMHEFDELFVLEIAKRAAQQIMLMPNLASLRWSSPVVKSFSEVGALVTFGEMWNASAKLVTANWIVDGSEGWLDFLLWLSPGERPEMEVINFRERWNTVPLGLVATNAQVADHPA